MNIELIGYILTTLWVLFLLFKHPKGKIAAFPSLLLIFGLFLLLATAKQEKSEILVSFLFINLVILVIYGFIGPNNEE